MATGRLDSIESVTCSRFDNIERRLESLETSVAIIENEVTNKIPALFEAYGIHEEKFVEDKEKINSINEKVEEHDIRISYLEEKIV